MSMDEAMAAPIVETIGGKQVKFARLLNDAYASLESDVRQARLRHAEAMADRCKLSGPDRLKAINEMYSPWVDPNQVAAWLWTSDGAKRAMVLSLTEAGSSSDQANEVVKQMGFPTMKNLAWVLVGFAARVVDPGDEKGGDPPVDPTKAPSSP